MKNKAVLALALLFLASPAKPQSVFGRPILVTYDRSSSDDSLTPNAIYFTYRATLDPLTENCNKFSKIGGTRNGTSFTDTQTIPGITYCYAEAFYDGTTQSPMSDFPAIVQAQ